MRTIRSSTIAYNYTKYVIRNSRPEVTADLHVQVNQRPITSHLRVWACQQREELTQ